MPATKKRAAPGGSLEKGPATEQPRRNPARTSAVQGRRACATQRSPDSEHSTDEELSFTEEDDDAADEPAAEGPRRKRARRCSRTPVTVRPVIVIDDSEDEDIKAEFEYITVRLKYSARRQHETTVRVYHNETLRETMETFARGLGKNVDLLRFITFDGQRIQKSDTIKSLELENGDVIDVLEEQEGGA
ncbi:Cytoplasmic tRNA 2-thiolation protein 2 [Pestalotiopsis sp. IQ-011]